MGTPSLQRLARLAVRWYPHTWRVRYAEEVLDVLDQHRITLRTVADLMVNAAATRLDPAYRSNRLLRRTARITGVGAAVAAALGGLWLIIFDEPTDFGVTGAHDVAFPADGRHVLTDGGDGALRMWDLADPAHPAELSLFRGGDFVSISPDGRTVATLNGTVDLWDVSNPGRPRKAASLFTSKTDPEAAVFSSDGRRLATAYHEAVVLFDITDPRHPVRLTPLPEHPRTVPPQTFMTMKFSPDGRTLAASGGGADGMTLWDITDPAHPVQRGTLPLPRLDPGPKYDVMAFTPDGATLATTYDGLVSLWNIADPDHPALVSTVDTTATVGGRMGGRHNSLEVVITADGRTMVTVMDSLKASAWDISDPSRPAHLSDLIRGKPGPGIFRISPDGRSVVTADHPEHDRIMVWDIADIQKRTV